MKTSYSVLLSIAAALLLSACGEKSSTGDNAGTTAEKPATAAAPAAATPASTPSADLATDDQKFSYAVGAQVIQSIRKQGVKLDADAFALAVKDAIAGATPRVSQEEMQRIVDSRNKADSDNNLKTGETFRAEYAKKEGVRLLESGLLYRSLSEGQGKTPKLEDTVSVNYSGRHIDGKEFDSSKNQGGPVTFQLNQVVKGWQEALTRMNEGDKWEIVIPPQLGYGERGAGGVIAPNETLVFEVELLAIGGAAAQPKSGAGSDAGGTAAGGEAKTE